MKLALQSLLLRALLGAISATWRYRETMPDDVASMMNGSTPNVIVFWHGRMLPVWYRFRGKGYAALISGSRDGELLARYLERSLGYADVIRGSSSRGGSRALADMVDALRQRSCLVTPDGPRGPSRLAKAGALVAAARAGRGVIGVGWSCRRSIVFGSWDRMAVPWPFSRIDIRYCKIVDIDTVSSPAEVRKIFGTSEVPELRVEQPELDRMTTALNRLDEPS